MKLRDFAGKLRVWRLGGSFLDLATAYAAFVLSYITVYGDRLFSSVPGLPAKAFAFAVIFAIFFWLFSMHRGSWRYVSIPNLVTILKVALAAVVTLLIPTEI